MANPPLLAVDFHQLYKNLLNCAGIRSTSRSSPGLGFTAASPGLEPELHDHLAPDGDEVQPRFQFPGAGVVQGENHAPVGQGCKSRCSSGWRSKPGRGRRPDRPRPAGNTGESDRYGWPAPGHGGMGEGPMAEAPLQGHRHEPVPPPDLGRRQVHVRQPAGDGRQRLADRVEPIAEPRHATQVQDGGEGNVGAEGGSSGHPKGRDARCRPGGSSKGLNVITLIITSIPKRESPWSNSRSEK